MGERTDPGKKTMIVCKVYNLADVYMIFIQYGKEAGNVRRREGRGCHDNRPAPPAVTGFLGRNTRGSATTTPPRRGMSSISSQSQSTTTLSDRLDTLHQPICHTQW